MPNSSQVPGYDNTRRVTGGTPPYSGLQEGGDPTTEPGQYPPGNDSGIFGGPLPTGTGAPGTQGARGTGGVDPTNEPGQTLDSMTGLSAQQVSSTGAPGTQGAEPDLGSGSDSVTFTRPGSYLNGSYAQDTVRDNVSGPGDWTQANSEGYGNDTNQLPGLKGNQPVPGGRFQPGGGGRVLRGGRAVQG
jgi:hypothetical protein